MVSTRRYKMCKISLDIKAFSVLVLLPGKRGRLVYSSEVMHPTAHTSMGEL